MFLSACPGKSTFKDNYRKNTGQSYFRSIEDLKQTLLYSSYIYPLLIEENHLYKSFDNSEPKEYRLL